MSASWAFVRQLIFATAQPERDSAALRHAYGLPAGFTDPMLLEFGIADETIPVGPAQYIELLSPAGDASPLHAWTAKRGGAGGYGVAVQVPDIGAIRERAVAAGVAIVIEQEALGHRIMQLDPRRMGLLLDLDEVPDRNSWFWDDITPGPAADAGIDALLEVRRGGPGGHGGAVGRPARRASAIIDHRRPRHHDLVRSRRTCGHARHHAAVGRGTA